MVDTLAEKIVDDIIDDLTDRGGLSNMWEEIDEDIIIEIRQTWIEIVKDNFERISSSMISSFLED